MLTTNQNFSDNWQDSLPSLHHRFAIHLPGITEESRKTTSDLLKRNHESHHCFFNSKHFHNHLTHHLLAAFSLGAPPKRLEEIYESHARYQKPIGDITGQPEITEDNWNKFFSQPEYYGNYLRFWTREVKKKGVDTVIKAYLFNPSKEGSNDFFARLVGTGYHHLIHLGYGLEFSLELIVVEALALTSVSSSDVESFLLDPPGPIGVTLDTLAIQAFTTFTSTFGFSSPPTPPSTSTSALSIVDLIHSDHSLDNIVKFEDERKLKMVSEKVAEKVKEYAKMWVIDSGSQEDVLNKTKELIAFSMSVYAGPTRPGTELKLDFFLMHALTSSLFLPIYLSHLSLVDATRLLQAHFSATLAYYISQGRPRLYLLENLFSYKSQLEGYNDDTTNPWLKVIERAIAHEDEHLVKSIRTLLWGATHIDSLKVSRDATGPYPLSHYWLNSAKLTLDAIQGENWWDHSGVGFDETWNGKPVKKPDFY